MRLPHNNMPSLLLPCVLMMAAVVADFAVVPACAQETKSSDGDGDRKGTGQRRRGGWGSWRRDRDRDEKRDDRRSEESNDGDRSEPDSKARESADSPGVTPESYAKQLVDKLDKNDNKVLDGDERTALTGPARTADFNKDGFISREEIVASLASPTATSSTPSDKAVTSAPKELHGQGGENRDKGSGQTKSTATSQRVFTWIDGGKAGDDGKITRRTYRFTPARERLPSELPSWFQSQDKNGDGQVAMSEYARSWSKSTVARFQSYDANGDGVVTAKEAKGKK